jgi:hypothetical protein
MKKLFAIVFLAACSNPAAPKEEIHKSVADSNFAPVLWVVNKGSR